MAMWLFRRKSRRKRSLGNLSDGDGTDRGREPRPIPPRRQTEPGPATAEAGSGRDQPKIRRAEPKKLQRRERTYSFSPGRNDAIRVDRKRSPRRKHDDGERFDSGVSALGEDVFPRAPTLHNKRDGEHLMPRKKSSKKRRKEDHAREAEIKAMSNFMPVRPATDANTAGRPMKKDSRRVRAGFPFPFGKPEWDRENRSSDISLPIPESIHSSLSSDSEHMSYKVSPLAVLAPRPTIRYAVSPRGAAQPRRLSERAPYPEATIKAHKRVDDLANDLSASDLRELMERDQRRRERKRLTDQQKMERRLARRAEKQRSDEELAAEFGTEPPRNLERGVMGRELVGLGIDAPSAVITSSRRRLSKRSTTSGKDDGDRMDEDTRPRPLDGFHRQTSIPLATPASPEKVEEPVPPLVPPKNRNLLRSKKSRSKSPPVSDERTDIPEKPRKGSVSWTSIFRWGTKSKRSSGPSSFSNTSRDSMPTLQQPVLPVAFVPPRKPSTGVPKRTRSRFREDLPELPLSPPESPEHHVEPMPPTIVEQSPNPDNRTDEVDEMQLSSSPVTQVVRYDTPTSGRRSLEGMQQTPTSWTRREDLEPSPGPQSMSLASIDSEGSWLSGRLAGRRRSSGMPESLSRPQDHPQDMYGGSDGTFGSRDRVHDVAGEDHSIVDDEYLSRYTPMSATDSRWKRQSTGEARPSSDEDEEARLGSVRGQQPKVVQGRPADRMKSREGLLNTYGEEDEIDADDGEDGDSEDHAIQRATSVNLKRHARHISAGSARLLDLTPRSSVDAKRGFGA